MPKLRLYPDLGGGVHAAYMRDDVPLAHTVVRAEQGAAFDPTSHWPCEICDAHEFALAGFAQQWPEALAAAERQGATTEETP